MDDPARGFAATVATVRQLSTPGAFPPGAQHRTSHTYHSRTRTAPLVTQDLELCFTARARGTLSPMLITCAKGGVVGTDVHRGRSREARKGQARAERGLAPLHPHARGGRAASIAPPARMSRGYVGRP